MRSILSWPSDLAMIWRRKMGTLGPLSGLSLASLLAGCAACAGGATDGSPPPAAGGQTVIGAYCPSSVGTAMVREKRTLVRRHWRQLD